MAKVENDSNDSSLGLVSAIPLSEDRGETLGKRSIGGLVREIAAHLSTLVRAEVELAKTELSKEIRKSLKGSVYFIIALGILVFSLFFFFIALAELLADLWFPRSAAYGTVFGVMLLTTVLFGLLGYRRIRTIRAPQRAINTMRDTTARLTHRNDSETAS